VLGRAAVSALNHVIAQQEWPGARLRAHAGRTVTLRMPPAPDLHMRIGEDGLMAEETTGAGADLTISLRPSALPRLLQRDEAALRDVDITGAADLAKLAQELVRELAWDVEEDLSRVVGDVAAHRLVKTGREIMGWQQEAARRLAQNFAEYLTEERPTLVHHELARDFAADAARTRDAVDALETRIAALERRPSR
jgi:ubiquinone biosynthesis protein UbiJ